MKTKLLIGCILVLAAAPVASAAIGDVSPVGLTGLWRFQDSANITAATIGTNIVLGGDSGGAQVGPWTIIEPGLSDNGIAVDTEWGYFQVPHGIAANGGGAKVNEYTIVFDYRQTSDLGQWNALVQIDTAAHDSDADFWCSPEGYLGVGAVGYSTLTHNPNTWHRIALSVDNGNFWRAYADGVLFLDGAGQAIDGRFALNSTFDLFADNTWGELGWGAVGTVAVWGRALSNDEIADMGGWIDGATTPTPLTIVPEPATMGLLAIGGLLALRKRK